VLESSVQLQGMEAGGWEETAGLVSDQVHSRKRQKIAFYLLVRALSNVGMGRQLYETQPTRASSTVAMKFCDPYLEQPLLSVLYPATGEFLDETAHPTRPLCPGSPACYGSLGA